MLEHGNRFFIIMKLTSAVDGTEMVMEMENNGSQWHLKTNQNLEVVIMKMDGQCQWKCFKFLKLFVTQT